MRRFRKPYRIKKKKSIFRSRFFWLLLLILIIFGGLFYFFIFSSIFQIKEIKISGNQKVKNEELEKVIEEKIEKKILFLGTPGDGWFLASKSIFLVNLEEINRAILKKFPQIARVNLNRDFPNVLVVQIEERKPVAIFCQNDDCFSVDEGGIVFESNVTRRDLITLRKGNLNSEIKLGKKLIDKTLISQILDIHTQLKENLKNLIKEVLIVSEKRMNFKTVEGWEIYLNPEGDIDWQLTKLKAVLEKEIPQEKRKDLEYIELRFGNFAPYKYKD